MDLKSTITENLLEGLNRFTMSEERINKPEEINRHYEGWRTESKKDEEKWKSLTEMWDTVKYTNICIMGVLEGQQREKETENMLEKIMAEDFPNLLKNINLYFQKEAQWLPSRINMKNFMNRCMPKVKDNEKILKVAREKWLITYKVTPRRLPAGFLSETTETRSSGITYSKCTKKKSVNQESCI